MVSNDAEVVSDELDILKSKVNKLMEAESSRDLVRKLEARIDKMEKALARAVKISHEMDHVLGQSYDRLRDQNADAFARIIKLELTVFPNLATDMNHLYSVIGDTGPQAECPHERRDRKKIR